MKNLQDLSDKLNEQNAFPYFKCSFGTNICDSVTIYASKKGKDEFANGIFHNSPYLIIHIIPDARNGRETESCKYVAELGSWGFSRKVRTPMRKKTGNLEQIFAHLQKFFETL